MTSKYRVDLDHVICRSLQLLWPFWFSPLFRDHRPRQVQFQDYAVPIVALWHKNVLDKLFALVFW